MQGPELVMVLGALYAFVALRAAYRCASHWGSLFDANFSLHDRQLLGAATFYWLVPLSIAGGLLSALGLLQLWGLTAGEVDYGVYWTRVLPEPDATLSPLRRAALAAAPGLFSVAVACVMIAWTLRRPIRAAHNFLRLELARMLLGLTLLLQPTLSLWFEDGALPTVMRALEAWQPGAQYGLLLLHLLAMVGLIWLWRSPRMRTRYLLLASPLYDEMAEARADLSHGSENPDAQTDLAHSLLVAGADARALRMLEHVLEIDPGHPRAGYLAGVVALKTGNPSRASAHLCAAGQRLSDGDAGTDRALRFEVTLALGAARLALGDSEGALMTMEEATRDAPGEPRALFLHAEALVAVGRPQQARLRLEHALRHADGGLARTIRKRLSRFP